MRSNAGGWDDVSLGEELGSSGVDSNSYESSNSNYPQAGLNDGGTFKIRTDPTPLLEDYRLQLMNAYRVEEEIQKKDGSVKKVVKVKFKKNTKPRANKQGVEDIISYVQKYINNHTVQGNIQDKADFNDFMRECSNAITMHFHTKRMEWGILINDVDMIISNAVDLIHLFVTRTLGNKERELYGETYKENTSREIKPSSRPTIFQRLGGFLAGGGSGNKKGGGF